MKNLYTIIVTLSLIATSNIVYADIPKSMLVTYKDGQAIVDYSKAEWAVSDGYGEVYQCQNIEQCNSSANNIVADDTNHKLTIKDKGLFDFKIYKSHTLPFAGGEYRRERIWEQFIVNLDGIEGDKNLLSAIKKYQPYLSFHQDEEFFPVSYSNIFNRPISEFYDGFLRPWSKYKGLPASEEATTNDTTHASEFFKYNGEKDYLIAMKKIMHSY